MPKKYTFIDLFAGCGGLSEGFLQTGRFKALAHVEWEKPMVDTLRHRLVNRWNETVEEARRRVILFDIQKTEELIDGFWSDESNQKYGQYNSEDVKTIGLRGIVGKKHVDFIIGGPPCQAYSIHGRATDKNSMNDDYRNYLFESFCKVVDAFRPEVFVFENVGGLLSAKPGGIPVRNRIYDAFTNIGYEILSPLEMPKALYDACDFLVPQHRPRVIIIGVRHDSNIGLNYLYSFIEKEKNPNVRLTVRDAIGFLPPLYPLDEQVKNGRIVRSHQINPIPEITQHEARNHGIREQEIFHEWVENNMNHISHQEMIDYYFRKTGHRTLYQKYKSLEWDRPSHTVVAHLSKDGYMFIHPDAEQQRSITIREAACLMTFPMDYQFLGSTPYNYKMIGNAVPVNFARAIASGLYKAMDQIRR
jgi:DNA (cytosine-5)-methyltransferase 1